MIYLDYAANTPIEKEVLDTYYQATMHYFANPNANHSLGLQAKDIIDQITKKIAEQLHVLPEEIIYTSGASEANNLAIKGILERYKHRGKHVLISPLEHNSILSSLTKMQENGFIVEMLPLKKNGQVDVAQIKSLLKEDTILVSVCSVDSELGIRQPIEEIGKVLKDDVSKFKVSARETDKNVQVLIEMLNGFFIKSNVGDIVTTTGLATGVAIESSGFKIAKEEISKRLHRNRIVKVSEINE